MLNEALFKPIHTEETFDNIYDTDKTVYLLCWEVKKFTHRS